MFEALRARFNRKAADGEPAESRGMKRAKKAHSRMVREAYLKKQGSDYGGGYPPGGP